MSVTGWFNAAGDKSVTLTVEIGFGSGASTSLWNSALWNTGLWGTGVVWTDVTDYLMSASIRSGRNRSVDSFDAGTASLVLRNTDARFSPWNLSGPYVTSGRTDVRPWRPIRIRAKHDSTFPETFSTKYLFAGYVTGFQESYDGQLNVTTVTCVDELGRIARFNGYAGTPVGAGELTGARVNRILNNCGYTGERALGAGTTTCQATTLAQNALTELKLTADSEGGWIFCGPIGSSWGINFVDRLGPLRGLQFIPIYDEVSSSDPLAVKFSEMTQAYSGDLIYTMGAVGRVGGTQQLYSDPSARALSGDLRYSRTDLITESDTHCLSLATQRVDTYKEAEQRVTSVSFYPRNGPHGPSNNGTTANAWSVAFQRTLLSGVNVTCRPPGMAASFSKDYLVDSIEHQISMTDWKVRWGLSAASTFATTGGIWDFPAVWDSSTWFY